MKLLCSANSRKQMDYLLNKDIDGVIISIDKLSVNDSYYLDIDKLDKIDFKNKEIFLNMNKLMHNNDLEYLRYAMNKIKDRDVRILFYDMAVYKIAVYYDMVDKLVIYQDHLNASVLSNRFYLKRGITGSYITSDITKEELLEIKKNSGMEIFFLGYGYAPIFYSRRYLVSNYLKYINEDNDSNNYHIISDTGNKYIIDEEKYGTTIYTEEPINLLNYLDELKEIDYLVLRSNKIDDDSFNKMVDKFINREKIDNEYIGFFNKKTIYKVK